MTFESQVIYKPYSSTTILNSIMFALSILIDLDSEQISISKRDTRKIMEFELKF